MVITDTEACASGTRESDGDDEVLYQNQRTLIVRRRLADGGCVVLKQAFGAEAQKRLRHEASILARLAHVRGVAQALPGYMPGALAFNDDGAVPLAQVLLTQAPDLQAIVALALDLAGTLSEVHRAGVIHKDINPSNILLAGPERRPVLIDFNIASCYAEERLAFTHQSHIAGTLAYLSPEQTGRTGRPIDQRSDLYALGVTLYELTVGRRPFESEDLLDLIHDHLARQPTPPVLVDPTIAPALSDIIMRLLEKEADARYQTADGLRRDLLRLQQCIAQGRPDSRFPLGQDDFPLRLTPPSSLVGRQAEIAALQASLDAACRGAGRALLVAGAPGVGKSALINELQPMVTARRGWFVKGKFEQYQRDAGSAFTQALRALGRLLLAEPEAVLQRHRERILAALGPNAGIGPSSLPEFALLLGDLPRPKIDDPVEAASRMLQATVDLLRGVVTAEQPLIMVVDDLQWAPAISLRLMDALVTSDHALQGLLLVGAYRSEEVDAAHPLAAMLTRWQSLGVSPPIVRLGNLPAGDVQRLLAEMLGLAEEQAQRLAAALFERTGGNPYDTVEQINALRQDGLLTFDDGAWCWDDNAIRRHVGACDVVGLLARRIDRLHPDAQQLLSLLACLGGEVGMTLLQAASDMGLDAIENHLAPALQDGLIVAQDGHEREIRFRHDRVQQAMHERMLAAGIKAQVQLTLARRLSGHAACSILAAGQYLPACDRLEDEAEIRTVIRLFQHASAVHKGVNFDLCERYLRAAIVLCDRVVLDDADTARLWRLHAAHHAALCGLARLDEADAAYEIIARSAPGAQALADVAAVQITSLANRQRYKDAVALGLDLLSRLGLGQPEDLEGTIARGLREISTWLAGAGRSDDLERPELADPRLLAVAQLMSKTQTAAFFCANRIVTWLSIESHRLWVEHGPCPALMATLGSMPLQLLAMAEDFDNAYKLGRHLLLIGERRRYEPTTSAVRFLFANYIGHWFEPLHSLLSHFHRAREILIQAGDLQYGIFTYAAWLVLFEQSPSIDGCVEEIDGAFAMSARTGDQSFLQMHRASRQLYRTLCGEIQGRPWGSFGDEDFDEAGYQASIARLPIAGFYFHSERALSAAIFNDTAALVRHAGAALPLSRFAPGSYMTVYAQVLNALALALQLRDAAPGDRSPLLTALDQGLAWIRRRALDAPSNFLHLQRWIEAERAWATGDPWQACSGFDAAIDEAARLGRPMHRALITERAARFHEAQGLDVHAQALMQSAQGLYAAWGAKAKVAQLHEEFPGLRDASARPGGTVAAGSTIVSTDLVDVMSVLRASQALSSETSLARLNDRVGQVLVAMTGAASVRLLVCDRDTKAWQVLLSDGDRIRMLALEDAAAQALLPVSAVHYAQRTREPLLLSEATRDERFGRDPYFAGVEQSSMLVLPVLGNGELRAMLVLENRLSRGAFSSERLGAVSLIAGQLAVSLDNALLYASLEQKVAERTAALVQANERLELLSSTDGLTGVCNRRKFNETLDAEWLRARRTGQPIGLVLIDIDHFKRYNDHYGHQGGDACLQKVASTMRGGLRMGSDLVARYGGEEFVLLLPNTGLDGAQVVAERVRRAVEDLKEPHLGSGGGLVTISLGITSMVPSPETAPAQLVQQADLALYEAKRAGRNRVERAPQ